VEPAGGEGRRGVTYTVRGRGEVRGWEQAIYHKRGEKKEPGKISGLL